MAHPENPEANTHPPHDYPLPVVSEATAATATRDMLEAGYADYLATSLMSLANDNPVAYETVKGFVDTHTDDPSTKALIFRSLSLFHQLLAKQSTGDAMDEAFVVEEK